MSEVNRYVPHINHQGQFNMEPHEKGAWVMYGAYNALAERLRIVESERNAALVAKSFIPADYDQLQERLKACEGERDKWKDRANDNGEEATKLEADLERARAEAAEYKRLYDFRGKALERPCLHCGHKPARIEGQAAITETSPTSGGLTKEG